MTVETISIDSVYQIRLYQNKNKISVIEYCAYEQVIKAGIIDTNAIPEYLLYSPNAGSSLFIQNCASCHQMLPDFSESVQGKVPINKMQLKSAIYGPKHPLIDTISYHILNDFEILLLSNYLNRD